MNSFECSSPSELDKKFFGEQSLLSALSLEQLSTSRASNDTAADGSDARLSILASLCKPSDPLSPSQVSSLNSLNPQETDSHHLVVPLQGMSSTPHILLPKQKSTCFDQSYSDFAASQISWDVSLIKSESPKPYMELSTQEPMWSPKLKQSTQHSPAEVSPWCAPLYRHTWHESYTILSASAPIMHQGWVKEKNLKGKLLHSLVFSGKICKPMF